MKHHLMYVEISQQSLVHNNINKIIINEETMKEISLITLKWLLKIINIRVNWNIFKKAALSFEIKIMISTNIKIVM